MRKLLAATALATAGLLAGPIAGASAADVTFENPNCTVTGVATFDKALTNTTQADGYHFKSGKPGDATTSDGTTCSGKLNGLDVNTSHVKVAVDGTGDLSCTQSQSTAPDGKGTITFLDNNITLDFTLSFTAFGTEVALDVKGGKSGEGRGRASFAKYVGEPSAAIMSCNNGPGLKSLGFDAMFSSLTPLTSAGAPAQTGGGGGSGGGSGGGGSTGGGGGSTGGGGGGGSTTPVATRFTFRAAAQKLKTALTKGIAVTLKGNAPARADLKGQVDKATAKRYGLGNGKKPVVVAIGRIALTHAGQAKGYLKLTSPAKRKLKNAKNVKVTLVGTVSDATRHQTKVNKTVLLR
jgi:hypothetical protein